MNNSRCIGQNSEFIPCSNFVTWVSCAPTNYTFIFSFHFHFYFLFQFSLSFQVGVVFLPCGHLATCVSCAPTLTNCPVCRTHIQATVRTFLSWYPAAIYNKYVQNICTTTKILWDGQYHGMCSMNNMPKSYIVIRFNFCQTKKASKANE